jgi:pentose-5-phosphate-3-epimerase
MLSKYKQPFERVTQITILTVDPGATAAAFRLDIGSRIEVLRTPPGGGARLDQVLFIQKIDVSADPSGVWRIVWGVSPV